MSYNEESVLKKGLDALFNVADPKAQINHEIIPFRIADLKAGQFQPRKFFDDSELKELSESIQQNGILQPILIRRVGDGYEIVAGERRWRAAQLAGLVEVPCLVIELSDEKAAQISLIENIQRQDLNVIEEAEAFLRLITEFSMTHDQVAKAVGRSRAVITNMLRLLSLPPYIKDLLIQKKIEMGHARSLLTLNKEDQEKMADYVLENKSSVRDVEKLVQSKKTKNENIKNDFVSKNLSIFSELLSKKLSLPVKAKIGGGGEIIISIKSKSESDVNFCIKALTS